MTLGKITHGALFTAAHALVFSIITTAILAVVTWGALALTAAIGRGLWPTIICMLWGCLAGGAGALIYKPAHTLANNRVHEWIGR